ncbi:response regulator transcription factor [Amycolatopsis acidiphila]|uniref:Response regulator transcription factor n=1 Tax=Amycolatopsis acidiphila TaxID=715473 RepID=A0A557ZZ10_9PSEU|nr:response regulator transcription factor [Amycolatopsis acidiphila]TVT17240.1 response regulator transcription factor [Amycolatopsis acidiphila]UIJ62925.1 response regulator transcription factor [Amycolatopsis acidiphila]
MSSRIAWAQGAGRDEGRPKLHAISPRRPTVKVAVLVADPFVRTGVLAELRDKPGVQLVDPREDVRPEVVVAVTEPGRDLGDLVSKAAGAKLVLVADQARPAELWTAVEHGLVVLVPRAEANTTRLLQAISDAHAGRGDLPPEQLGPLLHGLSRLHHDVLAPRDLTLSGLSRREADVLRLLAEGMDTSEIAAEMTYSERTVKNILHSLLTRLGLRNRTHAVAYALREGMI